jgi:hypothetical protein
MDIKKRGRHYKKAKRKDCEKMEENWDILSFQPYKIVITL